MKLYTQTGGDGPELVLIHGWGLHAGVWDEFAPLLETGFRVTRIDLPGQGRSDWQGGGSLDEMVDALLEATPETAVWLGWSLGGLIATAVALKQPARVAALVTIASTPCFVRKPGWQNAMLPDVLNVFGNDLEQDYVQTLGRFLALQVRGSDNAGSVLRSLRAKLLAWGGPDTAGLRAGLEILRSTDLRDSVSAIACPTLIIMGERDTLVPVTAGYAACELFPDAQLQVIEGAGHAPFIAKPELVAECVRSFLAEDVVPV
jgi:pimeloyl-[acyl-carrier protein] methyl ester esterase